jgi:hypothetical protein
MPKDDMSAESSAGGTTPTEAPSSPATASGGPSSGESPAVDTASTEAPQHAPPSAERAGGTAAPRERRWLVRTIIGIATVLAVIGIFAVWANRQLLNADNWATTSTKLLQNEKIREATSTYLVNQLYAHVNVANELKSRFPPLLQPLAAPLAGALQNLGTEATKRVLANARVQEAWKHANHAADETFIAIIDGKGPVATSGGVVTIDLASIVGNITTRLGLPNVSSKLPPSVAHLTVLKSKQLKTLQDIIKALRGLALLFTIIVPLLFALAVLLARERRRQTLIAVGAALIFAGVVVFGLRLLVITQVTDSLVKVEANKPAGEAILSIATGMLAEIAGAFVIVGIPLIAAGWFAGPARLAVKGRRAIAPFLREQPVWTYVIVVSIMVLIFIWGPIPATRTLAGIIIFLALALFGTEVLRRQTEREFPARPSSAETAKATAPT